MYSSGWSNVLFFFFFGLFFKMHESYLIYSPRPTSEEFKVPDGMVGFSEYILYYVRSQDVRVVRIFICSFAEA